MSLGVVRDLRSPRSLDGPGEAGAYQEHLMAEYVLARLAHGVADGTIRGEIAAVEQFLDHAAVFAWEVEPTHADRFLGQAQRRYIQAAGRQLGIGAQNLRADRFHCEAQATGGDPLQLTHLFGISDPIAIRYCADVDGNGLGRPLPAESSMPRQAP